RVPNLALHLALETPIGASPLLDYLIVSSDSVRQGIDRLVKYLRLVNPRIKLTLDDRRDPARVMMTGAATPFEIELTVSLSIVRFPGETDDRLRAAHASFTHEPDDVKEYARVLRCPVRARASWNGWAVSQEALRLPLRRRDPVMQRWLERIAAA